MKVSKDYTVSIYKVKDYAKQETSMGQEVSIQCFYV
jgi:hypothetical protein